MYSSREQNPIIVSPYMASVYSNSQSGTGRGSGGSMINWLRSSLRRKVWIGCLGFFLVVFLIFGMSETVIFDTSLFSGLYDSQHSGGKGGISPHNKKLPKQVGDFLPPKQYSVIIDAGSSGSRVYVYVHDNKNSTANWKKNPDVIRPHSSKVLYQYKTTPGMASFGADIDDHKISDTKNSIYSYWRNLIEPALKFIPNDKSLNVPFYILATAGMRLLPKHAQYKIAEITCSYLLEPTESIHGRIYAGKDLNECRQSHVKVISGSDEALFGWLTVNYLMGRLGAKDDADIKNEPTRTGTIGFLDLGGASAQIAYEVDEESRRNHMNDLRNVTVHGLTRHVYVVSFLGYGANQARLHYVQNLNKLNTTTDFCLPQGYVEDNASGEQINLSGGSNFTKCQANLVPLLKKDSKCIEEPCLFNGVHAPRIPFDSRAFIGVSEYWWSTEDIFDLGGPYRYSLLSKKSKEFCSKDWNSIRKDFIEENDASAEKQQYIAIHCFKTAWAMVMLHDGFGFDRPDSSEEEQDLADTFWSMNEVKGQDASWTLGSFINLVVEPARSVAIRSAALAASAQSSSSDDEVNYETIPKKFQKPVPFIVFILMFLAAVFMGVMIRALFIYRRGGGGPGGGFSDNLPYRTGYNALNSLLPMHQPPQNINRVQRYMNAFGNNLYMGTRSSSPIPRKVVMDYSNDVPSVDSLHAPKSSSIAVSSNSLSSSNSFASDYDDSNSDTYQAASTSDVSRLSRGTNNNVGGVFGIPNATNHPTAQFHRNRSKSSGISSSVNLGRLTMATAM